MRNERSETQDDQYRVAVETLKQGHTKGVAMLQSLLQANARNVAARQALAGAYVGQRRWDEALALLGQGLALMPEQATWAMSVARIQVERGQAAEASASLPESMPDMRCRMRSTKALQGFCCNT